MENHGLWKRFTRGDKEALTLIFGAYFDELHSFGLTLTRSPEIVEDSMQDMFFRLWKNRSHLGEITQIRCYLLKALRHHIYDNLQWKNRFVVCENPPENQSEIEFSREDFIVSEQLNQETTEKLTAILNTLTNSQREAIYLRYFKSLDFKEIADIMSISVQSVRNAIHRGLLALREL
jgi:RNA polymerase sigma factor (sigma-70 family)